MTNQDICSKSSVGGDGETRTLTPLLAPDPKSGVSTFHHIPINPGFIHLKFSDTSFIFITITTCHFLCRRINITPTCSFFTIYCFNKVRLAGLYRFYNKPSCLIPVKQELFLKSLTITNVLIQFLGDQWDSNPHKHAPQACA